MYVEPAGSERYSKTIKYMGKGIIDRLEYLYNENMDGEVEEEKRQEDLVQLVGDHRPTGVNRLKNKKDEKEEDDDVLTTYSKSSDSIHCPNPYFHTSSAKLK